MRRLAFKSKTKSLSLATMWQRLSTIEDYPQTVKYCKKVTVGPINEGGFYEDITTLLWIPLKTQHTITSFKPKKEIKYFLPLQFGGKMWMTYILSKEKGNVCLHAEVVFDLGNALYNKTVGYVLERRLEIMFRSVFPEITDSTRL